MALAIMQKMAEMCGKPPDAALFENICVIFNLADNGTISFGHA